MAIDTTVGNYSQLDGRKTALTRSALFSSSFFYFFVATRLVNRCWTINCYFSSNIYRPFLHPTIQFLLHILFRIKDNFTRVFRDIFPEVKLLNGDFMRILLVTNSIDFILDRIVIRPRKTFVLKSQVISSLNIHRVYTHTRYFLGDFSRKTCLFVRSTFTEL